jgi:hypothetical protein
MLLWSLQQSTKGNSTLRLTSSHHHQHTVSNTDTHHANRSISIVISVEKSTTHLRGQALTSITSSHHHIITSSHHHMYFWKICHAFGMSFFFPSVEKQMDRQLQQLVWSKLPLNEFQRQDLLNDLISDVHVPMESKEDIEVTSQAIKKRKRGLNEQSGTSSHMN